MVAAGEAAQGEIWLSRACGHGRWAGYSGFLYDDDDYKADDDGGDDDAD